MTWGVLTTALGNSDITDGQVLYAADLVATFDETLIHRKLVTDATEYNVEGASFGNVASFTFGALNGVILGISFSAQIKNSVAGHVSYVKIRLNGTNLGTVYWARFPQRDTAQDLDTDSSLISSSDDWLIKKSGNAYATVTANIFPGLKLLDASTTFYIDIAADAASPETAYIQNISVKIIYAKHFTDD